MKRALALFIQILLLAMLIPAPLVHAQTETPPEDVTRLLKTLTPEERVGQLFLVTFSGTDTGTESQIYNLITNYHIGGVILQSVNNNFAPAPDTIAGAHELIANLQNIEWDSAVSPAFDPTTGTLPQRAYIPLFVGIEQDGDGPPYDQIFSGLTPMPNAMALGATWKPDLAQQIGEVQGKELAALGFNIYLGPSLDVLDTPNPNASGGIGTRSFGGDPYWVGEMGKAFISGLHSGSEGRMLVIAKHFPGLGSADRPADEEVPTVRKSLEQLKQIELAPFFAVTGKAPDALSTTDGLLVSHIRFQGFQGNIRATTRPVSFDQTALGEMLSLQDLSTWRSNGGLVISDDLSSRAVRLFYAPSNEGFSAPIVARDAFLAGNDMLYLGDIISSGVEDTYATTVDVLEFFAQRYREDPTFAQQVDEAVERILVRKYKLFGNFQISDVLAPASGLTEIGQSQQLVFDVARRAATLLSPDAQALASVFPAPPALRDRIVFITDTAQYMQCSDCQTRPSLSLTALQDAVVRLYGPNAGGQVSAARLDSYTFDDLAALLNGAELETMVSLINRANWVVLALSSASQGQPQLVSRFLSERQDLLREKRVILFSFTAPYYFDATDISKLTAYFGLYSKQPAFIDAAARLLYQEITPAGFSPVSIPGTGYDLIDITRPNPDQIITLSLDVPPVAVPTSRPTPLLEFSTETPSPTSAPEPTPIPLLQLGDTIYVRTGSILDHNQHIVPDGTVVRFTMLLSGEGGGIIQQVDQVTTHGMARASFALEKPGLVEIRASSEPATQSFTIQLDVSPGQAAAVTVVAPNPTDTPVPTEVSPTPVVEDDFVTLEGAPRLSGWMFAIMFIVFSALLTYWAGSQLQSHLWGWRWGICVLLGGLAGYNYATLGLPGSAQVVLTNGILGVLLISGVGELIGLGFAFLWSRRA